MAVPVSLTFPLFTDPFVLFENMEAANAFFGAITVSIESINLPEATTTTIGGVLVATVPAYAAQTVTLTYITINTDEGGDGTAESYIALSQTAAQDIKAKLEALSTQVAAMQTAMITAGILTT